jgi:hypothetical protein
MPQMSVFMSDSDIERAVSELLASGCTLVPDSPSEEPKEVSIDSVNMFRLWRSDKNASLFFAVCPEWRSAPFEWGKFERNGRSFFFIRQKVGGPTLDLFAPPTHTAPDGKKVIPHGFIGYHSTYWNPLTNQSEKPPLLLRDTYKQVTKSLCVGADRKTGMQRTYFVAKGAKQLIQSGWILGPPCDTSSKRSEV